MTAGLLAAAAVWCWVPEHASVRAHRVFGRATRSRRVDPALVAAALTPLAAVMVLGLPLGLVAGAVLAPMARRFVGRLESAASRQRSARIAAALPAALDLMVATLEVGRPPVAAFALAAEATAPPLGPELAAVAARLEVSADPDTVWRSLSADPLLSAVGRAFRRAETSGMPVAHVVTGVADDLRRERAAQLRALTRKVGVRTAAPLGACFLPAFFLVGIVPTIVATFESMTW
ncbi:MAG: hypothetical protein JWP31_2579 [Aeromicrobium sp.]|nr:hypothetical protein [Aeromicrobium sp.]